LFFFYWFDTSNIFNEYKSILQLGHNTTVSWAAIIHAHSIHGQAREALLLFHEMQKAGVTPNDHIYSSILGVIADLSSLYEGQNIHAQLMVIQAFKVLLFTLFGRRSMENLFMFL
jgi:pentatricopeptide repeat protein